METLVGILVKVLLFAFVVGMFTLVITMFVRTNRSNRRIAEGRAQLEGTARGRGWTYERRTHGRIDQYRGVGPFPGGGSVLHAWHHITGDFRGRSFTCFEYRYTDPLSSDTQLGQRKVTVVTVFVVKAPGGGPAMEVRRAGRAAGFFDARPAMELGVPAFDDAFRVVTEDESFARQALAGDLVPFLLADPQAKKSPLRLRGDEVFTWYQGALSPQAIEQKLTYVCDVLDRIPAQAWSAGARPADGPAAPAAPARRPGLWRGQPLAMKLVLVIVAVSIIGGPVGVLIAFVTGNLS